MQSRSDTNRSKISSRFQESQISLSSNLNTINQNYELKYWKSSALNRFLTPMKSRENQNLRINTSRASSNSLHPPKCYAQTNRDSFKRVGILTPTIPRKKQIQQHEIF